MSEFKGTKGEWIIKETSTILETKIMSGKIRIAEVKHYNQGDNDWTKNDPVIGEGKANAKLIACAPEMYKELTETITDLKILRNQINSDVKGNHLFEGMPELIDKWIERKEQLIKKATE